MSLATWKKEFYSDPKKHLKNDKVALKHAIKKWEGLTKTSLKKHGLHKPDDFDCIIQEKDEPGDEFDIGIDSCTLCHKYYNSEDFCYKCPLAKATGYDCGDDKSQYNRWLKTGNATPMIKALKRTLKKVEDGTLDVS